MNKLEYFLLEAGTTAKFNRMLNEMLNDGWVINSPHVTSIAHTQNGVVEKSFSMLLFKSNE